MADTQRGAPARLTETLRVLSVEDNEDDFLLLMRELRRAGYTLVSERVQTAAELAAALQRTEWDVILSDFSLPAFSAPEALAVVQASGRDLPFIIVSGTVGEATAVASLKAGAHDFLTKASLDRLIPAIQREMRDAEVRRQRRGAEAAAREQRALADALRETAGALTRTLDFEQLLDLILMNVGRVVPHDGANIMLLEGGQVRVVRRRGYVESATPGEQVSALPLAGFPTLRQMLSTGAALVIPHTAHDPRWVDLPSTRWVQAYLGTPFRAKDKIIGFLSLNSRTPDFFQPVHSERLQAFADHAATAVENATLFANLQSSNQAITRAYEATIEGWSAALDLRDKETEGHSRRVTTMTLRLAEALGLRGTELDDIRRGALLHDIGKMGIPDAILHKPAPLTAEEWASMRRHPTYAYDLLARIDYLVPALAIPYCHHEKWDGTGYPRGLEGEQIPLSARLFAIVDVWDALSSDRPYRPAWSPERVLDYLRTESGRHFDPHVVAAFIHLVYPDAS